MSNKRSSETQDANLFSPKRNQRKQIPFPTPPHNNAPQPGFSLQQTALPPHPMPVPYQNNLVLPQPSNALATAYQGPESVPNPSTNWTSQSSSTQSGAVVQVKNPVVPSHGGESGPTSLPTKRQKLGKDISIPQWTQKTKQ
ncbi:hypothetical protein BC833DRAFT_625678 [Globomyces pollinis-pini]|nr:hypothetical protein BC833DRAFT_625678 [Globomyces pollinis-pini]